MNMVFYYFKNDEIVLFFFKMYDFGIFYEVNGMDGNIFSMICIFVMMVLGLLFVEGLEILSVISFVIIESRESMVGF